MPGFPKEQGVEMADACGKAIVKAERMLLRDHPFTQSLLAPGRLFGIECNLSMEASQPAELMLHFLELDEDYRFLLPAMVLAGNEDFLKRQILPAMEALWASRIRKTAGQGLYYPMLDIRYVVFGASSRLKGCLHPADEKLVAAWKAGLRAYVDAGSYGDIPVNISTTTCHALWRAAEDSRPQAQAGYLEAVQTKLKDSAVIFEASAFGVGLQCYAKEALQRQLPGPNAQNYQAAVAGWYLYNSTTRDNRNPVSSLLERLCKAKNAAALGFMAEYMAHDP